MSAISSRPKVRKVSSTALPIAAAVAGTLMAAAWRGLSAAARVAYDSGQHRPSTTAPSEIGPLPQFPALAALPSTLTSTEKIQVSTLLAVSQAPCLVERPEVVTHHVETLVKAASLDEAAVAQRRLMETLEAGHQRVFLRSISDACAKAAQRIGFGTIEAKTCTSGELRVIATDAAGRSLVSEIRVDRRRDVHLETEVVGGEGCCEQLLDRFDEALEAEGVRSGPRARRSTGGVCQLDGARDVAKGKAESATRRLQRLQQKIMQRNR
jgi:hypothetical protein